jgi:hypothetical protein
LYVRLFALSQPFLSRFMNGQIQLLYLRLHVTCRFLNISPKSVLSSLKELSFSYTDVDATDYA